MLISPVFSICILVKDYYDIEAIEKIKSIIAKMPSFRFFISPQYREEPKFDIYVVSSMPDTMIDMIKSNSYLMKQIEHISVNTV